MGTLNDFRHYLQEREQTLGRCEKRLLQVQEKYEQFFQEICRVRESEFGQLRDHIVNDRSVLPAEFNRKLDEALRRAERAFEAQAKKLEKECRDEEKEAEKARRKSLERQKRVHRQNVALDQEEEELKERSTNLLQEVADFNEQIREMGRGFGFFKNFFRMRRIQKKREQLEEEQTDLAARIEHLRKRWTEVESTFQEDEDLLKQNWLKRQNEAVAMRTKLEHLRSTRARIIERSAIEEVLFGRQPKLDQPKSGDPTCPRCRRPNPTTNHFCFICGLRLLKDRPDFDGSLLEIAEVNRHHEQFSAGMRACQEIIGLVRGLSTGLTNMAKSVTDMIQTENRHPVPKLSIEVPERSIDFGQNFDRLADEVSSNHSLHPLAFAEMVNTITANVYSEPEISRFFETMGKELSRQADRQW